MQTMLGTDNLACAHQHLRHINANDKAFQEKLTSLHIIVLATCNPNTVRYKLLVEVHNCSLRFIH